MRLSLDNRSKLREALAAASYSYTSGLTHGFYHYPARFSPDVARAVIDAFSSPGDVVLDPFMGGGTSIIEGLVLGRRMIGVDINALATFVADVRTNPLSETDAAELRKWAAKAARKVGANGFELDDHPDIVNLPRAVEVFVGGSLALSDALVYPRQRQFARCALLRLGQLALDCRDFAAPRRSRLAARLPELVESMLYGLDDFVEQCRNAGTAKNQIASERLLLHRSAVGLDQELAVRDWGRARLVLTSPPYPSVHVLYHRWQYRGRKETAAPYWIARVPDGFYESYYTGGSRTPTGRRRYFEMIASAFKSVRRLVKSDAVVAQLVGFSDYRRQLPQYLAAMTSAGFEEIEPVGSRRRLDREVPNRKWYAKLQGDVDAASEILLLHKPI